MLPRQVCGLYTKNLNYSAYPGGPAALERNILGGALFDTVLYNYVSDYNFHSLAIPDLIEKNTRIFWRVNITNVVTAS